MKKRRGFFVISALSLLFIILFAASLKCGIIPVSWKELLNIFSDTQDSLIIRELRLARSLAAIIAGAASAFAGVILQKILRNDLAAPDILGISSGSGVAGVTLLLLLPQWSDLLPCAAFAGALIAALLIYLAAWQRNLSPGRLILAGVAVSTIFSTVSGTLFLFHAEKLFPVMEFTLGGFAGKSMDNIYSALPVIIILLISGIFLPRKLELLSLGDDEAFSLGLSLGVNRIFALAIAALAGALCTSLAGLLGFIGLMAPHIARKITQENHSRILLIAAPLTGSVLALAGDLAGRLIFAPRELPAGLPISLAGAVFFLLLLTQKMEAER